MTASKGIPCPDCRGYIGAHSTPKCPRAKRAVENRERWLAFKARVAARQQEVAS